MKFTSIALALLVGLAAATDNCPPQQTKTVTNTVTNTQTKTVTNTQTKTNTVTNTVTKTSVRVVTAQPTQTQVNQSNACGNGAAPYCCIADGFGYSECSAMSGSSQCSQTTVCCNANNSVQSCIGNAVINNNVS